MNKKQKSPRLIGVMKEPYASIVEKVSQRDRIWFEQHPDRDQYVRDYKAGEFEDHVPPMNTQVLVTKINEDMRARAIVPYSVADLVGLGLYIFVPQVQELREKVMCPHSNS